MKLRRLIFEDFGLKLFSLGVALLIWAAVYIAVEKETDLAAAPLARIGSRTFHNRPVLVVSQAMHTPACKVSPSHVEVTVRGEVEVLSTLKERDVHVIVDLDNPNAGSGQFRRVEVSTLTGFTLQFSATPEEVEVFFPK